MDGLLQGLHIAVTGGTGALGVGVVEALVASGGGVHIPVAPGITVRPNALWEHPHVHLYPDVDLADERAAVAWYERLPGLWASVHLAGGFEMAPVADTSLADFSRMHDMNLLTAFLCCREAIKAIRRTAQGGRLVNVAARPALLPTGGMVAYSTSKAAVASLTTSLAEEVVHEDILVNAILPSIIDTPANRAAMPKADHASWPTPRDLAVVVSFLVSPDNRVVRGALIPVYGKA